MSGNENNNFPSRKSITNFFQRFAPIDSFSGLFIGLAILFGLILSFAISLNQIAAIGILLGIFALVWFCRRPEIGLYIFFFFSLWERVTILPDFSPATGLGYLLIFAFFYNVVLARNVKLQRIGQEWLFLGLLTLIFLSSTRAIDHQLLFRRTFTLIQLMIMYYLVVHLINSEKRLYHFFWIVLFATVVSAGVSLFQRFQAGEIRVIGVGRNPNYTSATLILGLGAAGILFKRAKYGFLKYAIVLSGGLLFFSLLFTYSRGGLLAFSTGGIYVFLSQRKNGRALLIGGLILVFTVIFMPAGFKDRIAGRGEAGYSSERRIEQVRAGLMMIRDHPLIGVGFNNYEENYAGYVTPVYSFEYRGAHNTYIQLAAEIGLSGLVIFLGILFNSWRSLRKVKLSSCCGDWLRYSARITSGILIAYLVIAAFAGLATQKDFWMVLSLGTAIAAILQREKVKNPDIALESYPQ